MLKKQYGDPIDTHISNLFVLLREGIIRDIKTLLNTPSTQIDVLLSELRKQYEAEKNAMTASGSVPGTWGK